MAESKASQFDQNSIELAEMAKALAHPARIAILRTLAERDTCICGEIVEVMPLAQSTVSQHLRALKKAGLVNGELDGTQSCYCINREKLGYLIELVKAFETSLQEASACC